jgi:peroxiredoxin (alkyl hydroperoxide reductase subunit C)
MSNGRNFKELYRLLVAMQTADTENIATPADWQPGDDVIVPPPGSCGAAKDRVDNADAAGHKVLDWFLAFKKLDVK